MSEELARLLREMATWNDLQAALVSAQWPAIVEHYRNMGYYGMWRCVIFGVMAGSWIIGGLLLNLWMEKQGKPGDDRWIAWFMGTIASVAVLFVVVTVVGDQLTMINSPELVAASDILNKAVAKATK